jgi:hypothetical protein
VFVLKRLAFGAWEPDKAEALLDARNVVPIADGYRPFPSFTAITPALPSGFLGGAAFVGLDGTAALLSGTATNLYRYSGGTWSSVLAASATTWRFAQYGSLVIAANGGVPVKFDLSSGTASVLAGSPPASSMVATVRDFVFVAGNPSNIQTVTWSGFNNAEGWTGAVNQSGSQLLFDGGEVMGLVGGEYGLAFQKRAIKRFTYVGTPLVFQVDEIASNIGCMAKGSLAQAGRTVFFLSERGFYRTDGTGVEPIGDEKFNRWFFGRFSRADIETKLTAAIDPRASIVYWAMPGVMLAYHYGLGEASYIEAPIQSVFGGFTANTSLDALDALYPGGIDTIPVSLDDPLFAGGNPLLLAATPGNVVGTFSGPNMASYVRTARIEAQPGRRVRTRTLRPITDAVAGTVTIDSRALAGDVPNLATASDRRDSGTFPIRSNGRHIAASHSVPAAAAWSYVRGIDVEYETEGTR